MGADFTIITAPVSEKTKEEVVGRIDKMGASELLNLADYLMFDDETPDEVRGRILEAVKEIVDVDGRDFAVLTFDGKAHYITGGMSWGDSPTDSFDFIWLLGESQVTDDEYWKSRE
jgi:hypothetical protein